MIGTVKMSSKGQIVIPQGIRDKLHVGEGTIFSVIGDKDTLILKKVNIHSKEELIKSLQKIAKKAEKKAEKLGIKENDVLDIVHRFREEKRKER